MMIAQAVWVQADGADNQPAKKTSNNVKVSVEVKFNLFSIEGRPLEGSLKSFSDEYKSKNKTEFVLPTELPKPMMDGKPIDLTAFYQKCLSQLVLPDNKKSFRDTVFISFYLDEKGKVVPTYFMEEVNEPAYRDLLNKTNDIKNWSPAYFDKTPGQVAASIRLVISDGEIK